jgi:hypothetical protein
VWARSLRTAGAARTFPVKPVGGTQAGLAIGDFSGDGVPDVAAVSNNEDPTVDILLGDGTGNFKEAPAVPVSSEDLPVSVATADLDGDGNLDLKRPAL